MTLSCRAGRRAVAWLGGAAASLGLIHCVGDAPVESSNVGSGEDASIGSSSSSGSPGDAGGSSSGGSSSGGGGTDAGPGELSATSVAAGKSHTCAVLPDGNVVCWGSNGNGELGSPAASLASSSVPVRVALPESATQVTAGDKFSCALLASGAVSCWGDNETAQVGRLPLANSASIGTVTPPPNDTRGPWAAPQFLSAGGSHVCATIPGEYSALIGEVGNYTYCWGKNTFRQLQAFTNAGPSPVPLLATLNAESDDDNPFFADTAVAGADFTCTIGYLPYPNGSLVRSVVCWGASGKNQTGKMLSASSPMGVPMQNGSALFNPRLLAVGDQHACALAAKEGGGDAVYCWGQADQGAIGTTTSTAADGVANVVGGLDPSTVTVLAAGGNETCVVAGGVVSCLGANQSGQRGDGTIDNGPHPAWGTVDVPPTVSSLSVGGEHVCAVFGGTAGQAGAVRCWGSNRAGQLGDGLDLNVGYTDIPGAAFVRPRPVTVRSQRP